MPKWNPNRRATNDPGARGVDERLVARLQVEHMVHLAEGNHEARTEGCFLRTARVGNPPFDELF